MRRLGKAIDLIMIAAFVLAAGCHMVHEPRSTDRLPVPVSPAIQSWWDEAMRCYDQARGVDTAVTFTVAQQLPDGLWAILRDGFRSGDQWAAGTYTGTSVWLQLRSIDDGGLWLHEFTHVPLYRLEGNNYSHPAALYGPTSVCRIPVSAVVLSPATGQLELVPIDSAISTGIPMLRSATPDEELHGLARH